jgi:hypothetical protein
MNNEIKKVVLNILRITLRLIRKIQNLLENLNELNSRNASSQKTISSIKVGEETINTSEDIA